MARPTEDREPGLDLSILSDVAKKRRTEAKEVLEKRTPDLIKAIRRSEVAFTIDPVMLPYSQMDFTLFRESLARAYNSKFKLPDLSHLQKALGTKSLLAITEDQAAQLLLGLNDPTLIFENGRFPVSRNEVVTIPTIRLDDESVHVAVEGVSKIAELVVAEVVEAVWASTGVEKRWDEVKQHIQLVKYGTATKVDLGFPAERFLHPTLRRFFDEHVIGGQKFAAAMGALSARDSFGPSPSAEAIYNLDELHVNFHRFDSLTGRYERTALRFSTVTKDDARTGVVVISSQLPFDQHVDCLIQLVEVMKSET